MSNETADSLIAGAEFLKEEDGIYYSPQERDLSYPDEGNDRSLLLEESSFWFSHRNDCICMAVSTFPPPVPVVFDVGGGNGFVSKGLQESGVSAVVVEPMKSGARNAKSRGIQYVVCSSLGDAGFKEKTIPAVGLFDVLEHIEDDVGFLKGIADLLNDDGLVYLTVPAYEWLWSRMDEVGGHYRRYTLRTIEDVFQKAGFSCVFQRYFFGFLPLPMLLTRVIPESMGISEEGTEVDQSTREHGASGKIGTLILELLCKLELTWLKLGWKIPFGGSCLIVARKELKNP